MDYNHLPNLNMCEVFRALGFRETRNYSVCVFH